MIETNEPSCDPPTAILRSVGLICRDIGKRLNELEATIVSEVELGINKSDRSMNLQQLDIIIQSNTEVSLLLERLDQEMSVSPTLDFEAFVASVRLEWMRNALSQNSTTTTAQNEGQSISHISIF